MNHDYLEQIGALTEGRRESVRGYLTGLVLSLSLTLAAYVIVVREQTPPTTAMSLLVLLALLQYFAQATYFLHVRRAQGRERRIAFGSFTIIVLIVVVGSLWVMTHLDARMMAMDEAQMAQYMHDH